MANYSERPGAAPASPRQTVSRLERDTEAARRDRPQFDKVNGLVQLGLEEVDSWPPGTTRLVGDDYPLEVKLSDGTWLPIPPPAPPSGGGISGVTRCDAWDYSPASAGTSSTMMGVDWHFSSLYGSTGPTVTTGGDAGAVYVAAAGWYMATLNFNITLSAPTSLSANITFTGDNSDYPTDWNPLAGSSAQVRLSLPSPWVLLPAGGWFQPSLGWTSASVSSFHHFTLDITKG